jgi:uncharacterized Zn-finger protein
MQPETGIPGVDGLGITSSGRGQITPVGSGGIAAMQPVETKEVDSPTIACDGDGGALGHPRIYLNMGEKSSVDCPYCGRHYVLREGAAAHAH